MSNHETPSPEGASAAPFLVLEVEEVVYGTYDDDQLLAHIHGVLERMPVSTADALITVADGIEPSLSALEQPRDRTFSLTLKGWQEEIERSIGISNYLDYCEVPCVIVYDSEKLYDEWAQHLYFSETGNVQDAILAVLKFNKPDWL